jgi:PAN domain
MSQVTSMRRDPRVYSTLKKGAKRPIVTADSATLERYTNKKFDGPPYLVALASTLDDCENNCRGDNNCSAFNFVTTTNICYLIWSFSGKPVTSPATESGLRFQPPT